MPENTLDDKATLVHVMAYQSFTRAIVDANYIWR